MQFLPGLGEIVVGFRWGFSQVWGFCLVFVGFQLAFSKVLIGFRLGFGRVDLGFNGVLAEFGRVLVGVQLGFGYV